MPCIHRACYSLQTTLQVNRFIGNLRNMHIAKSNTKIAEAQYFRARNHLDFAYKLAQSEQFQSELKLRYHRFPVSGCILT